MVGLYWNLTQGWAVLGAVCCGTWVATAPVWAQSPRSCCWSSAPSSPCVQCPGRSPWSPECCGEKRHDQISCLKFHLQIVTSSSFAAAQQRPSSSWLPRTHPLLHESASYFAAYPARPASCNSNLHQLVLCALATLARFLPGSILPDTRKASLGAFNVGNTTNAEFERMAIVRLWRREWQRLQQKGLHYLVGFIAGIGGANLDHVLRRTWIQIVFH